MGAPAYPKELLESEWKKTAGKQHATLEKDLGIGGSLAMMKRKFDAMDFASVEKLEKAVKSKDGGEIQTLYAKLDDQFDVVERLTSLSGEFSKICNTEGTNLKKKPDTKAIGEWLVKSGMASETYFESLEKYLDKLREDAEKVPMEKIADHEWELNDWDLTHLLTKVLKIELVAIELPDKKPVTVSVKGKTGAAGAKNAVLRAEFFEAAYDVAKKLGPSLKNKLEDIDERFAQGVVKGNNVPALMSAAFGEFETAYAKDVDKAIQKIVTDLEKDRSDYTWYQVKTTVSIGSKVGGIAVGVASIATAGWTGAGTVLGVATLLKSSVELVSQCMDAWQEARDLGLEINKSILELKEQFAKDARALTGTKEVAKDALERLTGFQMNGTKAVKEKLGLFGSKIQGCNVKATNMGKEIDESMREVDGLSRKIAKAETLLKGVKGVDISRLSKKHDQVSKHVGELVKLAADYKEDYKKGKESLKEWIEISKELQGSVPEVAQKIQKWAVPLLDFAFAASSPDALIKTGLTLSREYIILGTQTEKELKDANEVGSLAGDVSELIVGLVGK